MARKSVAFTELLKDAPNNWGRWGADDEIGALNFLTNEEVLRGARAIRSGKVFMLGVPLARPGGDPLYPTRSQPIRTMAMDKGFYHSGLAKPMAGGLEYADDVIVMFLQGTTQYDALGHVWYDDKLYNGFDPKTTIGGLQKCSIEPIANHGVVGRGILLDIARLKGKANLDAGEPITGEAQQAVVGAHPDGAARIFIERTDETVAQSILRSVGAKSSVLQARKSTALRTDPQAAVT